MQLEASGQLLLVLMMHILAFNITPLEFTMNMIAPKIHQSMLSWLLGTEALVDLITG